MVWNKRSTDPNDLGNIKFRSKGKRRLYKDNSASNVTVNNFWKVILNLFFRLNYTLSIHFIKYVYIYMHMYIFIYPEWESYARIFCMHILYYIWNIFLIYIIYYFIHYILYTCCIYILSLFTNKDKMNNTY